MISKNTLQSFISKYNLSDMMNQTRWKIKDNTMQVHVGNSQFAANVLLNSFPLDDGELGIYDSNKLAKLIGITSNELLLSTESHGSLSNKLNISDSNFELSYSLADPLVIPKINYPTNEEWHLEIDLEREDIDNLIKAKNALSDSDLFSLKGVTNLDGDTVLEFVFGDDSNFASKVNYQITTPIDNKFAGMDIQFSANNLKEVLNSNKDSDATKFSLHYGDFASMIKIKFDTEEITSIYKMLQKEKII